MLDVGCWVLGVSPLILALTAFWPPPPADPTPKPSTTTSQKKIDFESQILPIFKRNCLSCHNATDAEADLVLETPATIAKGGEDGPVVVPHKGEESLLIRTAAHEAKPHMPPKNNKVGAEILKPDELALVKAWIDEGATGTVHVKSKTVVWHPLPPGQHPILAVAVTPDGQYAACGRANQIFVYHVPTGQVVARLTDPKLAEKTGRSGWHSSAQRDFVQSLAFSPDGRILASGEYRMVKLWHREPNLPQFTLGAEPATALAVSPDGKWIATAAHDNVIRLWDSASGHPSPWNCSPATLAHVTALAVFARTTSASPPVPRTKRSASNGDVAAGNACSSALPQVRNRRSPSSALAWIIGGKQLASAGGDNSVRLWDFPKDAPKDAAQPLTLTQAKELTGPSKPVTALEASPDGKQLYAGSADNSVRQWAADSGKQVRQMDQGAPVVALALSPNGKTLATAGGNSARLWNTEKGQQLGEMKGDHRTASRLDRATQWLKFQTDEVAYWKGAIDTATKAQTAKADAVKKAKDNVAAADKTLADKKAALDKVTKDAPATPAPAPKDSTKPTAPSTPAPDDKAKTAAQDAVKTAESAKTTAANALKTAEESIKDADEAVS